VESASHCESAWLTVVVTFWLCLCLCLQLDVWGWDSAQYLGKIPQVNHTYNVVGNSNEFGLSIGETTFGG
jgi:hypothetical protein